MTYTSHWLAARWFTKGGNLTPTRVVVHTTETPPDPGAAAAIARYFHTVPNRKVSAHAVVDATEAWGCVDDGDVAYHAPPNARSLGVELATRSSSTPATWADAYHDAMLVNAAQIVGAWCRLYDVPVRLLTVAQLRAGERGICGHVQVSAAFGQTSHTDPGPSFPWARFLQMVAGTEPAPTPPEDEEMLIVFADKTGADQSQVLALDGKLYVIDEGATAQAIAGAGYKTLPIGHTDYAQLKAEAEA